MSLASRIALVASVFSLALAAGLGATAWPGHGLARGSGVLAISLLLFSLACSPLAQVVPAGWAVAARSARRTLGIGAASVAIFHAAIGLGAYLDPITLGPLWSLPWLRHGALAGVILVALLLTSFPASTRALRVRAWSPLHRLVYVAASFSGAHALAVPFGTSTVGVVALALTALLLLARVLLLRSRRDRADD